MFTVVALYCFTEVSNISQTEEFLRSICVEHEVKGNLIIAREGINGTVAVPNSRIDNFIFAIRGEPVFSSVDMKLSQADEQPFYHTRIHSKPEIVTMGVPGINPNDGKGIYVEPEDWNALISDPDTIVIDTRNDYEVKIGRFVGAQDPATKTFREFPQYIDRQISAPDSPFPSPTAPTEVQAEAVMTHKTVPTKAKIAMYCTGGIRCEKATALLRAKGFDQVFHLRGGILRYLDQVPPESSLWEGECYVFDQRVSVTHGVKPGSYMLCRGCRMPLSPDDISEDEYPGTFLEGVHCRYCVDSMTEKRKVAALERQMQIKAAAERGDVHLGYRVPTPDEKKRRREMKKERGRREGDKIVES